MIPACFKLSGFNASRQSKIFLVFSTGQILKIDYIIIMEQTVFFKKSVKHVEERV
jgi:hypothetical protein